MLNFYFEPMSFVKNLKYMGIGMLGVFVIIFVIILATHLTSYFTSVLAKPNDEE